MSTNEQTPLSQPTSAMRNTLGREQAPQNLVRPVPNEDLREYCDKNYHQILLIIAEKLHQEKVQQEKLKALKARLNFKETSQYSESETSNRKRNLKERLGPRSARTRSISPEQRRGRSKSPREKGPERRMVFKRLEKGVFLRLVDKEKNVSTHSRGSERKSYYSSRRETESCYQKEAFKEMKQSIAELPMLTVPKEKEELIIYLAAAKEAISAVLMTERDGKQVPIYFVTRALQGPEINYTPMEKLILTLVSASKQLKRYFQAHTIVVITNQPIKQLLSNPEVTGRLLKWRFELGEHDIQYRLRTSVKGQILADFIVERPEDGTPDTPMEYREELPNPWILFTDGSSCVDGFGAGLIIMNPKGMEFTYALRFRFNATNNEVEYEALIAGLRIANQIGIQNLQANVDSKLVASQAHRTMIKSSNGETPFSLTYEMEAVIRAEIGMPTLRTAEVGEARNKAKMVGYYNARVRSTSFRPGDFVYRNNEASHAEDGGKLRPKWEGP
nr:reverse transcriptase domain-containing protein [Tanacetum cinerariifolium]